MVTALAPAGRGSVAAGSKVRSIDLAASATEATWQFGTTAIVIADITPAPDAPR